MSSYNGMKEVITYNIVRQHPEFAPDWLFVDPEAVVDDSVVFIQQDKKHTIVISSGAVISSGVVIYTPTEIGVNTFIGHNTIIRDHTSIMDHCKIGGLNMFEGKNLIGDHVYLNADCHITRGVVIGRYSFFGAGVIMANDAQMLHYREGYVVNPPRVGAWVRIGNGTSILPGVEIGDDAFIGASSLVTKDVPRGELWFGSPAKSRGPAQQQVKVPCKTCGSHD